MAKKMRCVSVLLLVIQQCASYPYSLGLEDFDGFQLIEDDQTLHVWAPSRCACFKWCLTSKNCTAVTSVDQSAQMLRGNPFNCTASNVSMPFVKRPDTDDLRDVTHSFVKGRIVELENAGKFFISRKFLIHSKALTRCPQGTRLLILKDYTQEKLQILKDYLLNELLFPSNFWISLSTDGSNGWAWGDGTDATKFGLWSPGKPTVTGFDGKPMCGRLNKVNGEVKVTDYSCNNKQLPICEVVE